MSINPISSNSLLPDYARARKRSPAPFAQEVNDQEQKRARDRQPANTQKPTSAQTVVNSANVDQQFDLVNLINPATLQEQRVQKLNISLTQRRAVNAYHDQQLMDKREQVKSMMGFEAYA